MMDLFTAWNWLRAQAVLPADVLLMWVIDGEDEYISIGGPFETLSLREEGDYVFADSPFANGVMVHNTLGLLVEVKVWLRLREKENHS